MVWERAIVNLFYCFGVNRKEKTAVKLFFQKKQIEVVRRSPPPKKKKERKKTGCVANVEKLLKLKYQEILETDNERGGKGVCIDCAVELSVF